MFDTTVATELNHRALPSATTIAVVSAAPPTAAIHQYEFHVRGSTSALVKQTRPATLAVTRYFAFIVVVPSFPRCISGLCCVKLYCLVSNCIVRSHKCSSVFALVDPFVFLGFMLPHATLHLQGFEDRFVKVVVNARFEIPCILYTRERDNH